MTAEPTQSRVAASDVDLDFIVSSAVQELGELRDFSHVVENFLDRSESEAVSSLQKHAQEHPRDQQNGFWTWNYPAVWQGAFAPRLRSAVLTIACSIVEVYLTLLCNRLADIQLSPPWADLSGDSKLCKLRKALVAAAGADIGSDALWAGAYRLFDLRNFLLHNGGLVYDTRHSVSKLEARTVDFIEKDPLLSLENGFVEIEPEFGEEMISLFANLMSAIHRELRGE